MKKLLLVTTLAFLLISSKNYQGDSDLTFDYQIVYKMDKTDFSVFASKANSKNLLLSMTHDKNAFTFLQETKFFALRISDSNDVDLSRSRYEGDPSNQDFNELVETNDVKTINDLKCTRFIAKSPMSKSQSVEVYIAKNNKINNVHFLFNFRTKTTTALKGLVLEMNSIDNTTNKIKPILTFSEIKPTKKIIKITDADLKKLIEKKEYETKHKNDVTITAEVDEPELESSSKLDLQTLDKQLQTGRIELGKIEEFPFDYIYEKNKNITTLTINESPKLKSFPESVKNFKSLAELSIFGAKLAEFPTGFCYINSLTSLTYGGNLTTVIPQEIGNLKNLKNLTLYSLPLKEIPKEIGNLENLQLLFIDDTKGSRVAGGPFRSGGIQSIPKEIGNLKSLVDLELNSNNLTEVPKEIGSLNKLSTLTFSDNNLKSLPKEIYYLQNLEILDLSNNPLEGVSKDIDNLKNLKLLNLRNTTLKSLPKEIYNLQNLETLLLSGNLLESIPETIFNLKNLKRLDISKNKIPREKIMELMNKMPNTRIIF